ncbi:antitoxin MazE [Rhizobium tibeticum]|uniref:Antitoxin ChpS n=1 Tax=Rhizobium tibeticum TaxID=501024 RepID=A0A1H8MTU4_9HYPH|nr:AbrB/MazE/SpoVT family DNA-binding domain-containing protein [Rhizobium tibeticum]SEI11561.1 Antitoxin ChpS [Rhizobium tibeticum]SEO20688.1 antitoxin MazE [Rhizobium tibeticum]
MLSAIKKFGNSAGVIIPKPLLSELGAQAGDEVDLRVENGRIVIERVARPVRKGWAADAQRLAAERDDGLVWPEFGNDEDETIAW